ncbi:MAG TPA: Ig-like domain-containing protein, partial [Gemmatimonadaceae bacterium]|nr:Ig-like domain-containing protein [Gemmatimonadaceae bacterium]
VAVTHFGGMDSLRVHVQQDSAGKPGPVLESIPIGGWSPLIPTVAVARSRIFPVLPRGIPVWISLTAGGAGVISGWNWNSIGDVAVGGNMATTQGGSTNGPWGTTNGLTRGALQLNGSAPAYGLKSVTIDDLALLPGGSLAIDGAPWYYAATLSNRSTTPRTNVALQGWIEQGSARRAAGGQLVTCTSSPGVLPFGTCVRPVNGITASNATAGTGTLVPGPAWLVASVVQLTAAGSTTLATRAIPVTLTSQQVPPAVLGVTVSPPDTTIDQVGVTAQLAASVQAVGGASTAVMWASSNPAVAPVSSTGRVTAVSPGAALITVRSAADPTKVATSLVSVLAYPARGNNLNVSPGRLDLLPGGTVPLAAQVIGGPSSPVDVYWMSGNTAVAVVDATGRVTAVAPGTATITVVSKLDPTKSATVNVTVHDLRIASPNAPVSISTGNTQPPANPTSVTLVATVTGPSGIFMPPFTSVAFFATVGGSLVNLGSGSMLMTDNGMNRVISWQLTWTPGTAFGTGPQSIVAVAYNAAGRVGTTLANTLVTLTDP